MLDLRSIALLGLNGKPVASATMGLVRNMVNYVTRPISIGATKLRDMAKATNVRVATSVSKSTSKTNAVKSSVKIIVKKV